MRTTENNVTLTRLKGMYDNKKKEAKQLLASGDLSKYIRTLVEVERIDELMMASLNRKIA